MAATATAASDGATASTTVLQTCTVTNVAPTSSITGDTSGVRGQARTYTFSATDPSSTDRTAGFAYSVNWGDGSPVQVIPRGQSSTITHTFTAAGNYIVKATATDKDGAVGPTASYNVAITAWAIQADPFTPGTSDLVIGGTTASDNITLYQLTNSNALSASINGAVPASFTPPTGTRFARVIVYGQSGDDYIHINANVTSPAWLYGGDGNDDLLGGSGNNVIVAGAGDDVINRRT
ncbi:PKD domain-containing protein, partial [Singulisphaera rosea]